MFQCTQNYLSSLWLLMAWRILLPRTFATTVVTDIGNYQVDYNENHIRYIYNLFVLLINKLTNKP